MAKKISKTGLAAAMIIVIVFLSAALVLLSAVLERRTYKLVYPGFIKTFSSLYELDPFLVAAVIHCESDNVPNAVSRSGAVGLMQIMPETGEWIAGKLEIEDFSPEDLNEPELNIRIGCWYLRFLYDRYDGNMTNMLAAYNAGHGNADKWLSDKSISEEGQLLNIPFKETKDYVEKVLRVYDKYKALYSEKAFD
ncbi:MAG: Soluble lytic murein transglycosylase precursor [Firmicutes bacterium ADurb.Bin182]|nr:MAG: Soluble lytic murein transglycosylase precursor [Firmicutes bacterium ADurb.Bin182]